MCPHDVGRRRKSVLLSPTPCPTMVAPVSYTHLPGTATVASMKHLQFTARISGTTNTSVTWSASGGTISSSGLFTAPQVTSTTSVIITATSPANHVVRKGSDIDGGSATSASATVTVMPPVTSSLAITNSALPTADAGVLYTCLLYTSPVVCPPVSPSRRYAVSE